MHYDPLCKNKHACTHVCISQNCQVKNPFICNECRRQHLRGCEIIPYKKLVHEFHKRQGLFKADILKFEERVQITFNELIKGLKAEFIKFREQFEYTNITSDIENVYTAIKLHQENELTSYDLWRALQIQSYKGGKFKMKDEIEMRFQKKKIMDHYSKVIKGLPPYYSLKEQIFQQGEQFEQKNQLKDIKDKFVPRERRTLVGLIKDHFAYFEKQLGQTVYDIHLLYRASENNFSATQFHKKCDGIKNTLTIAKTEHDRIVIGYCTFPWQSPKQWMYKDDDKRSCFLLSCTEGLRGRKYLPFKTKFSIGMHAEYGPSFGDDFVIYNKAQHSKNCWSNFPDVYRAQKNSAPHSKETINKFIGVNDHFEKFNLKEWEVFYISFGPQDELLPAFMRLYEEIQQIR